MDRYAKAKIVEIIKCSLQQQKMPVLPCMIPPHQGKLLQAPQVGAFGNPIAGRQCKIQEHLAYC